MKFLGLMIGKDGGPDSNVDGVLFEIKRLFSVGILRFKHGSREAFHSHAFNCVSLVLKGYLLETFLDKPFNEYRTGDVVWTKRSDLHKVYSNGTTYVLTLRGPWVSWWFDVQRSLYRRGYVVTQLEHGRGVVMRTQDVLDPAAFVRAACEEKEHV